MKKCQRAIKHYKEQEERVREIGNGIESQILNDSRRLWQWIGRQLCGEKSRKAMVIKKGILRVVSCVPTKRKCVNDGLSTIR